MNQNVFHCLHISSKSKQLGDLEKLFSEMVQWPEGFAIKPIKIRASTIEQLVIFLFSIQLAVI